MRFVIAAGLLTGCLVQQRTDPPPPNPNTGWTGPQGDPVSGCTDAECGSDICARDGVCYPASSVRVARAKWTIGGAAANTQSCSNQPDLFIGFLGNAGEQIGFAPVPCRAGQFTVDKLPTFYTAVELGVDNSGAGTTASINSETGEATLDLPAF